MKKEDYFLAPLSGVALFGLCYVCKLDLDITGVLALAFVLFVPLIAYLMKKMPLVRKAMFFDLVTLAFALFLFFNKKYRVSEDQTFLTVFGASFLCALLFFLGMYSFKYLRDKSDNAKRQSFYCGSCLVIFILCILLFA